MSSRGGGGAGAAARATITSMESPAAANPDHARRGLVFTALYFGYLLVYAKRAAFDTAIPFILADASTHVGQREITRLLSRGALAYGVAKAVAGSVSDYFGGQKTMAASLVLSGLAFSVVIGGASSAASMTAGWVLVRIISTGPYPALCSLAKEFWPGCHGSAVGALATASRAGSMLGAVLFSWILGGNGTRRWRPLFRWTGLAVAASGLGLPWLLAHPQGRTGAAASPDSPRALGALHTPLLPALGYFARLPRVWLGTLALAAMCPVFELASLIPIMIRDMPFCNVHRNATAIGAAVFQLGAMLSTMGAGFLFDRTPPHRRAACFAAAHAVAIAAFELLRRAKSPMGVYLGLTGVMLGGAPVFYIPTTAIFGKLGGPHAGALYSLGDLPGFVLASWCFLRMPRLLERGGWPLIFRALQGFVAVSGLAICAMLSLDAQGSVDWPPPCFARPSRQRQEQHCGDADIK